MHALIVAHLPMQAQNANMDGGMLDVYPSPADLRKQQVADIQAKRQEKVPSPPLLPPNPFPVGLQYPASCSTVKLILDLSCKHSLTQAAECTQCTTPVPAARQAVG